MGVIVDTFNLSGNKSVNCRRPLFAHFLILLFFFPGLVLAEKWYFEPKASMRLGYNDNTQLSTSNKIDTFTSYITADAAAGFRTEVSDVSLTARMIDRRFKDQKDLNTNDQFLDFKSAVRSGLNLFGLDANYERESTRTSEFDFTGFSNTNKDRITKSISPYWSRTLTERTSVRVGGSYTDVTYKDAEFTSLNDYTYKSVFASTQHQLSERTSLQLVLSKSLYTSGDTEYDSTSAQFGMNHMLSETLSGYFLVGPNYTKSEFIGPSGKESASETGRLLDIGFRKRFEVSNIIGSLKTTESAGGQGNLTRRTFLRLSFDHKFSTRTFFKVSAQVQENEGAGGNSSSGSEREYFSLEPKLSWKATPWWKITGSYRYRRSENTNSDAGPAKSNAVYLSLEYIWPRESYRKWMDL